MITYIGNTEFDDVSAPTKGKNEWGLDTLTRKLKGARVLAPAFLAALRQGQVYQAYFLQEWQTDDDPVWATITLNYKGVLGGGTPVPKSETQIVASSGSESISFATENEGVGRAYRVIPLYSLPTELDNTGAVQTSIIVGRRNVYTTGAQVSYSYNAVQTVYNYITIGRPAAPRYRSVLSSYIPVVLEARGITADGSNFGKNQAIFDSFNIQVIERVIGFTVSEVVGTPFFECQDVVRKELGTVSE